MNDNLVYFLDGKTYINITNACTNRCLFCIRDIKDDVKGASLWLSKDDIKADDVIEQLKEKRSKIKSDIIFCGYGEPLLRLEEVKQVARYIKENMPHTKIRINTNGHAGAVFKKNIAQELAGLIDEISISLNAQDEALYNEISRPTIENAYNSMLDFAAQCVKAGIPTTLSVVTGYKNYQIDVEKCKKIAQDIGAKFRARKWEESGY